MSGEAAVWKTDLNLADDWWIDGRHGDVFL